MKKKGFTLVELLGILTILGIIAVIITPSVDQAIKNGKQKAYDTQKKSIIIATEDWLSENKKKLFLEDGEEMIITLGDLKAEGHLPYDFKNPKTGNCFSNLNEVIIQFLNKKYEIYINGKLLDGEKTDCGTQAVLPTIYLKGKNPVKINQGKPYIEPGYTAQSTLGKDLTSRVVIKGNVDTSKIGKTTLKYSVSDNGLTKSKTRVVQVMDTEKPKIVTPGTTVLNSSITTFDVMEGVYVTDNSGEDLKIKSSGTISLGVYGTYYVDYVASDFSGNTANVRRRIIIADETPGYCFEFDASKGEITDYYQNFKPECNDKIRIPQVIDGVAVEYLGNYSFFDKKIYSVIMPPNLKKVGGGAFEATSLEEVDFSLATDLTSIEWFAFSRANLKYIDFSANLKLESIGIAAFYSNNFEGTLDLSSATGLKKIGQSTVHDSWAGTFGNNNITKLILPTSIELIGHTTFSFNNIASVNFNDLKNLHTIADHAFEENNFKEINISNLPKLNKIENGAFENANVNKLTLRNNPQLVNIGGLWDGCGVFEENKMTSLIIENNPNLTTIGQYAFRWNLLSNLDLSNSNIVETGEWAFTSNKITDYSLPSSMKRLGSAVFNDNQLPDSLAFVKDIGNSASIISYGGAKRSNVIIPANTVFIEEVAFSANSLSSVNFDSAINLERIGFAAFRYNDISEIKISNLNNLVEIEEQSFIQNKLTKLTLSNLPKLYIIGSESTSLGAFEQMDLKSNLIMTNLPNLAIIGQRTFAWSNIYGTLDLSGTKLKKIDFFGFVGNNLTEVKLPNTITHLGEGTFNVNKFTNPFVFYPGTKKLVSYASSRNDPVLPSDIEEIGAYSFDATYIKTIDLSKTTNLRKIETAAFAYTDLREITIPSSVTEISDGSFTMAPLAEITIQGDVSRFNSRWKNIGFPMSSFQALSTDTTISTSQPNDFNYVSNSGYKITIPMTGKYKIETWGAQGGYTSKASNGGKGGYTSGEINLTAGDVLHVFVGASGKNSGYNGGGNRVGRNYIAAGGGASDVRIGNTSLYNRVIVAGGGGSEGGPNNAGGYAGGLIGQTKTDNYIGMPEYSLYQGQGGTQTQAGGTGLPTAGATIGYIKGAFGRGGAGQTLSSGYGAAGGGGWFGGSGTYPDNKGDDERGGGGGSSFVFTSSTSKISGYALDNKYQMTNTVMKAGNENFTAPDGTSETGHSGNGKVRIQFISN